MKIKMVITLPYITVNFPTFLVKFLVKYGNLLGFTDSGDFTAESIVIFAKLLIIFTKLFSQCTFTNKMCSLHECRLIRNRQLTFRKLPQ